MGLSIFQRSDVLLDVNSQPGEADPLNRLGFVGDLLKCITYILSDGNGSVVKTKLTNSSQFHLTSLDCKKKKYDAIDMRIVK